MPVSWFIDSSQLDSLNFIFAGGSGNFKWGMVIPQPETWDGRLCHMYVYNPTTKEVIYNLLDMNWSAQVFCVGSHKISMRELLHSESCWQCKQSIPIIVDRYTIITPTQWNKVLQYMYNIYPGVSQWHWPVVGWNAFQVNPYDNITMTNFPQQPLRNLPRFWLHIWIKLVEQTLMNHKAKSITFCYWF